MSDEGSKPPATSDNSLALSYIGFRARIKFDDLWFKQDKVTFNHKTVVNIYITYEIKFQAYIQSVDFTSGKFSFGGVNLTKNADFDKCKYSEYGMGFFYVEVFVI